MPSSHPQVLVADDNHDLKVLVATLIEKKFCVTVQQAGSLSEATKEIRERHFDIVFFGISDWLEGVELYIELLNESKIPCQFILFMDDPTELSPGFDQNFTAIRKPDYKKLIAAADWSTFPLRIGRQNQE